MNTTANSNHISNVRQHLLDALADLREIGRNTGKPLDLDQVKAHVQIASAIKGVADTLVDSARAEVEYLKVTKADRSDFLEPEATAPRLPSPGAMPTPHNPFPVSARHTLGDD
jgi:hypothetical protein